MAGPKTYTREDILEIQCHGGVAAVRRILELVIDSGARLAEPGEFTKRAFLNGRIDLTQVEAVIDAVHSRTAESLALSNRLLSGELKETIFSIREKIAELLTHVEAAIDFPEEEVEVIPSNEAIRCIQQDLIPSIDSLLETFETGRLYREGLDIVIVGKPNVGKSSLLNCLLHEQRAIVTPHPGTTRDSIEAGISLDGLPVRLVDTAGLRETEDEIERVSLDVTRARLKFADLVLWVLDLSREPDTLDDAVFELLEGKTAVAVANKRDLCPDASLTPLRKRYPEIPILAVSALYGEGIDDLKRAMHEVAIRTEVEAISGPIITRLRHKQALDQCREHLEMAVRDIMEGMLLDRLALDLRDALDDLGRIVGLVTTEDILDRIFSEFCIGK
jgi:tRNA modification GTPase